MAVYRSQREILRLIQLKSVKSISVVSQLRVDNGAFDYFYFVIKFGYGFDVHSRAYVSSIDFRGDINEVFIAIGQPRTIIQE